jgi:hypoxanthine phosphoribosyltransferase
MILPLVVDIYKSMPELIPVLSKNEIERSINDLASRISDDYQGRDLVLIGILKGAFIFMADLLRQLTVPAKVDFLRVSSYGSGTSSSGKIRLTKNLETDINGSDVLIVEDIVDTGLTLTYLIDYIKTFHPGSVKVCSLINKHENRKQEVTIDYYCHDIEEGFLVGYGLDYDEHYRNLPDIYHLKI